MHAILIFCDSWVLVLYPVEILQYLPDAIANVYALNSYGQILLYYIVGYDEKETVNLLLDAGTDINVADKFSSPPVFGCLPSLSTMLTLAPTSRGSFIVSFPL